jgi:hypothetical protein
MRGADARCRFDGAAAVIVPAASASSAPLAVRSSTIVGSGEPDRHLFFLMS